MLVQLRVLASVRAVRIAVGERAAGGFPVCQRRRLSSAAASSPSQAEMRMEGGRTMFSIPLPTAGVVNFSHHAATPVRQLVAEIAQEDEDVSFAEIKGVDGTKWSGATPLSVISRNPFVITINDKAYTIQPPAEASEASAMEPTLADLRAMVESLHRNLDTPEQQARRAAKLQEELESIKEELAPMEEKSLEIEKKANNSKVRLAWAGLAGMSFTFGFLYRLTWWDYSWDLMEPVTFFLTYGTGVAFLGYYVVTRREYDYEVIGDRKHAKVFHKVASREGLDLERMKALREAEQGLESRLNAIATRL